VSCGKRGRLVKKEHLRVACAHHLPLPIPKPGEATDPGLSTPACGSESPVGFVQSSAAIAHEQPAGRNGVQRAIGRAAVLKRRGSGQVGWPSVCLRVRRGPVRS
jgi:hypothetical protein